MNRTGLVSLIKSVWLELVVLLLLAAAAAAGAGFGISKIRPCWTIDSLK